MFLTFIFAIIWLFILIALIFLATLLVQDSTVQHHQNDNPKQ